MFDAATALDSFQSYTDRIGSAVSGGGISGGQNAIWSVLLSAQDQRGFGGNGVEIGVWHGHGSAKIAQHLSGDARLLLIDKFVDEATYLPNIAPFLPEAQQRIVFHRGCSIDARKRDVMGAFRGTVRWAHIDGEHSYEAVRNDLDLVADLMCDGGVIALDDMFDVGGAGLTEALFHWLGLNPHKAVLFLAAFNKAYLCAPRDLPFYMRLAHGMPDLLEPMGVQVAATRSGWGAERPCVGLTHRYGGAKYMKINQAHEAMSYEDFFG